MTENNGSFKPLRVIIAGGRNITNEEVIFPLIREGIAKLLKDIPINHSTIQIVSGGCRTGPDRYGELYAKAHGLSIKKFPADWSQWGKAAGPIRNKSMAEYADALILIWDGKSKGSANMFLHANDEQNHRPMIIFNHRLSP